MTDIERRMAAKQFAADWNGKGDEKQETQSFWLALLQKVYGIPEPEKFISFEKTVTVNNAYVQRGFKRLRQRTAERSNASGNGGV